MFPFHARTYETRGYFPYIHIGMVIAAIVLPLESVGVTVLLGTGGLTIPRFPPVLCFARETDATFFSLILPVSIINAIGVSLITIILWVVITKVGSMKIQSEVSEGVELENCLSMWA